MKNNISTLPHLQRAFDDLYNRMNEVIIRQVPMKERLEKIKDEPEKVKSELAAYIAGECAKFAKEYDRAFFRLGAYSGTNFDFGRDWESAVRALADMTLKDLRSKKPSQPSLEDLVAYAYDDFQKARLLSTSWPEVEDDSASAWPVDVSTKALLHCWLLELDRRAKRPNDVRLKADLTEYLGDSRVYFATASAIIAMPEDDEAHRSLIRQGHAYARSALRRSPNTPGLHHLCALYCNYFGVADISLDREARLGLFRQAVDLSSEAIDLNPAYHRYWATRADAYRHLQDFQRAKEDLRSARELLEFDPRHPFGEPEYVERRAEYDQMVENIRRDEELHRIVLATTVRQDRLDEALQEARAASKAFTGKSAELNQEFRQLELTVERVESDATANRREQIQLVAIVAAFIGLIASTVPVVGAGASRVEETGGAAWELLLLLLIPAALIVVLIVALNATFRRTTTAREAGRRSRGTPHSPSGDERT